MVSSVTTTGVGEGVLVGWGVGVRLGSGCLAPAGACQRRLGCVRRNLGRVRRW